MRRLPLTTLFLTILFLPFLTGIGSAQVLQLEPTAISVGGGSMLGEEQMTFSWKAAFAAIHWHGVEIAAENVSTGIGVEVHPSAVLSVLQEGAGFSVIEEVDWRLWSLNRIKTSVFQIPGDVWEQMFLGSDLLIQEGGSADFTGEFTARFVYGVRQPAGPGDIQLELYMFEKYRPISFAMFYRF